MKIKDIQKSLVEDSYDRQAGIYDSLFGQDDPFYAFEYSLLDRVISIRSKVLDLGCGTGRHAIHLAKRGNEVTGLDLSANMIEHAKKNALSAQQNVMFLKGDMADLSPFADCTFDFVICLYQSFGYVPTKGKRAQVAREVHRVLCPGGTAIFDVYNLFYDFSQPRYWGFLFRTFFGLIGKGLESGDNISSELNGANTYCHLFAPRELKRTFIDAKFRDIQMRYVSRETGREITGLFSPFSALVINLICGK